MNAKKFYRTPIDCFDDYR